MESYLTPFGEKLSHASRFRLSNFDTSTKSWPDPYKANYQIIQRLKNTLVVKPNVLVLGAGFESQMVSISNMSKDWLKTGVHWTNFHPDIEVDIITSAHVYFGGLYYFQRKPLLLIHGVYSKGSASS